MKNFLILIDSLWFKSVWWLLVNMCIGIIIVFYFEKKGVKDTAKTVKLLVLIIIGVMSLLCICIIFESIYK